MLMFSSQTTPTKTSLSIKGEHVEHLESPIEGMQKIPEDSASLTTHSVTTERLMAKNVEPDTLNHHATS